MEYTLLRSDRKTISVRITPELNILVRAPRRMPKRDIDAFLLEKKDWIEKHLASMEARTADFPSEKLSGEQIRALADQALLDIPPRVEQFAKRMGVTYGRITIRNQVSRWGSCSSSGNLNFNCLLMLAPPEVRDYVVVHELCHRKEMNHSPAFWAEVVTVIPDYKAHKKWLNDNGTALISRLR